MTKCNGHEDAQCADQWPFYLLSNLDHMQYLGHDMHCPSGSSNSNNIVGAKNSSANIVVSNNSSAIRNNNNNNSNDISRNSRSSSNNSNLWSISSWLFGYNETVSESYFYYF